MSLNELGQDWDLIAEHDAFWAVLSDPEHKHGKWDKAEFFSLGEEEIQRVLDIAAEKVGPPVGQERALDFGCGLGRLSRALSNRFTRCDGIDISEKMITQARELNADKPNLEFSLNQAADLSLFEDHTFDFIYSSLVLQHVPHRKDILNYISEFVRVLAPNGQAAFQLPPELPLHIRLQPRRTLFAILKAVGFSPRFLYWQLGLPHIRMSCVSESTVVALLQEKGAPVRHIGREKDAYFNFPINTYFCQRTG